MILLAGRPRLTQIQMLKPTLTCIAALTSFARPCESFFVSSPSSCRRRICASPLVGLQTRTPAAGKERWPISSTTKFFTLAGTKASVEGSMTKMALSSSKDDGLFLFDFDGVVCDSCDECTVSAWRTCKILQAISDADDHEDEPPKWLFDKMREIRPAIEVGWQIPVLLSVFLEQKANATPNNPAMGVPEIIQNYEALVEEWLQKHKLKDEDMIQTFGQVRDDWIANDLNSWLDINTFYNGISQGITDCRGEAVLVTTKQHRFATALVRHAGIEDSAMPDDSIYGLGMYKSKSDVIFDRMQSGGFDNRNTHFFEDRWPTIAKCLKDDRLERVKFYLCSWGYCTEDELNLARSEPRVEVLTLDDFANVVAK